jgi:hypothetical protein
MSDPFQSKPNPKMPPKAAKTVAIKLGTKSAEVVSAASINSIALDYIRQIKTARAQQK